MKKISKYLLLVLGIIILPKMVSAAKIGEDLIYFDCRATSGGVGSYYIQNSDTGDDYYPSSMSILPKGVATCTLKGTIWNEVAKFSGELESTSGVTIKDITKPDGWDGTITGNVIDITTNSTDNKVFPGVVFTVTVGEELKDEVITLKNISITDSSSNVVTKDNKTFTFKIGSDNNYLSSIKFIDDGKDEALSKIILDSDKVITYSTSSSKVTIVPELFDSTSTISGDNKEVELKEGENKFSIVVTSQIGESRTYNIIITRTGEAGETDTPKDADTPTESPKTGFKDNYLVYIAIPAFIGVVVLLRNKNKMFNI